MPSVVPIFLKMSDEKQVIYFPWPYSDILLNVHVSAIDYYQKITV